MSVWDELSRPAPDSVLGDGVDQNDRAFTSTFPYIAAPWSGSTGAALHGKPGGKP